MNLSTTNDAETVTCQNCGNDVPKRNCCGVGNRGNLTWTCADCIKVGAMDRVFEPIGKAVSDVLRGGKQ